MGVKTAISWTSHTWNPWRGCKKVSPGCANCYMFRDQYRYGLDPTVVTRTKPQVWNQLKKWQKAAKDTKEMVFTCSWSDWFIEAADEWRPEAWELVKACPNMVMQILTKRPELIKDRLPPDWGDGYDNVGLGVSVENKDYLGRIEELIKHPAKVHFVSAEPLIGSLKGINLKDIEWLIAGGESGPNFRPMKEEWAIDLRDKCAEKGVSFFYKQGSSLLPGKDNTLAGQIYEDWPPSWLN